MCVCGWSNFTSFSPRHIILTRSERVHLFSCNHNPPSQSDFHTGHTGYIGHDVYERIVHRIVYTLYYCLLLIWLFITTHVWLCVRGRKEKTVVQLFLFLDLSPAQSNTLYSLSLCLCRGALRLSAIRVRCVSFNEYQRTLHPYISLCLCLALPSALHFHCSPLIRVTFYPR